MLLPKPLTYISDSFISDIRRLKDTVLFQNSKFIVSSWSMRVTEQMVCWIKHFLLLLRKLVFQSCIKDGGFHPEYDRDSQFSPWKFVCLGNSFYSGI